MGNPARTIELPEDLQAFAEERVRAGEYASVADVIRDALEQKKLAALRAALDTGIAELDAGLGVETTGVVRSPRAKQDIIEILLVTKERWDAAQARAYRDLIKDALRAIAADLSGFSARHAAAANSPAASRACAGSRPGRWSPALRRAL